MNGKHIQRAAISLASHALDMSVDDSEAIIALTGAIVEIAARSTSIENVVRIAKKSLDKWVELCKGN